MSDTQDLIAAALSAADELDFIYKHAPVEHSTDDLREACARAMVQPDVSEVERLVREYGIRVRSYAYGAGDCEDIARTALLDAVRAIVAERDALREAAKMVSGATCPECGSSNTQWHCSQYTDSGVVDGRLRMHDVKTRFFLGCNDCSETIRFVDGDDIARLISTSAQEVSAAPQPVGEFCTDYHCPGDCGLNGHGYQHAPQPVGAAEPAENSYEWFQREIQRLQKHVAVTWPDWMQRTSGLSTATFPAVSTTDVPMPDIAGELFDGKRVCDEADVRTYGDAREAAGYAAGVAAHSEKSWSLGYTSGYNDGMQDGIRTAALRGEVK